MAGRDRRHMPQSHITHFSNWIRFPHILFDFPTKNKWQGRPYRTSPRLPGNVHVCLQVWDIGVQSIGGKMIQSYIYGAQAICLVYDVTAYQTFQDLEDWFRLVRKTFDKEPLPYMALIGNKKDLYGGSNLLEHLLLALEQ